MMSLPCKGLTIAMGRGPVFVAAEGSDRAFYLGAQDAPDLEGAPVQCSLQGVESPVRDDNAGRVANDQADCLVRPWPVPLISRKGQKIA